MKKKLVVLMFVLLMSLLTACGGGTSRGGVTAPPTVAPPSPVGTIRATISSQGLVGQEEPVEPIAASDTAVWVHNWQTGTVVRIDPRTNQVVATIPVGLGDGAIALGQGVVWVASADDHSVSRIDPQSNRVVATVQLTLPPEALAVSPGAVWVASREGNTLWRIDSQTNRVLATIPTADLPNSLSFGAGSLWICALHGGAQGLTRLDPQTNRVLAQIDIGAAQDLECGGVLALADTVWIVLYDTGNEQDDRIERIDPGSNTIRARITVPTNLTFQFAADEQGLWVFDMGGIYRINPRNNQVVGELPVPGAAGVALGAGSVWLCNSSVGTLLRITPAS